MERAGHWRAVARKRYGRRLTYLSGDGPWVCLYKCRDKWSYALCNDQIDAITKANKSCGPDCGGKDRHKVWKLVEVAPTKAKPRTEPKVDGDEQSLFWEQRLGVSGL